MTGYVQRGGEERHEVQGHLRYRAANPADWDAVLGVLATANFRPVPSPEMPELNLDCGFVAEDEGEIVGVAGFKVMPDGSGKTTLMAVDPRYRGQGVGQRLHELRMDAMLRLGCTKVVTNADRPTTIAWYQRKFGYTAVGSVAKLHEFGDPEIDRWTTLQADLEEWVAGYSNAGSPSG